MQLLDKAIDSAPSPQQCARDVLEVVPQIMRVIRSELRRRWAVGLSVTQFRTLVYLDTEGSSSLSALAEHIGLTLPSMSKLVDGLVEDGFVNRGEDRADRRRLVLCLTPEGREAVESARARTQAYLAERLSALPAEEQAAVAAAMSALRPIFASEA